MSATDLIESLFPRTRTAIFRHLLLNEEGLHLRELERRSSVNSRHLMRELHSLRDAGILVDRKVGNLVIYRLNPACPIYKDLESIIQKTVGLHDRHHKGLRPLINASQLLYISETGAQWIARRLIEDRFRHLGLCFEHA